MNEEEKDCRYCQLLDEHSEQWCEINCIHYPASKPKKDCYIEKRIEE